MRGSSASKAYASGGRTKGCGILPAPAGATASAASALVTAPSPTMAAPPPNSLIASRRVMAPPYPNLPSAQARCADWGRPASLGEQPAERLVDPLGVGPSLGGAHHRALEGVYRALLARLEVGRGLRVRRHGLAAPAFELAEVGLRPEPYSRDHGAGRVAGPDHVDEPLLGRVAQDGALSHQPDEPRHVGGPHLRLREPKRRRPELAQEVVGDPVAGRLRPPAEARSLLEEVAQLPVGHEDGGYGVGNAVLLLEPALLVERKLGAARANRGLPFLAHLDGHKVRIGEIAVIVRHFLRPERFRLPRLAVVVAGLLHHRPSGLDDRNLPADLEGDPVADKGEGVQVLELDLGAERGGARRPYRDVRVAAQLALLHVAVRDPSVDHDRLESGRAGERLVRASDHGLRHDLHDRRARPVEVDEGHGLGVVQLAR